MKKWLIVIGIIIVVTVAGVFTYFKIVTSPKYSLWQLSKAVKQHDLYMAEKYIDLGFVLNSGFNKIIEHEIKKTPGGEETWEKEKGNIDNSFFGLIKTEISKYVIEQAKLYVMKGKSIDSQSSKGKKKQGVDTDRIMQKLSITSDGFKGIDYVKKDDAFAFVGIKLVNDRYNKDMIVELKMQKVENNWKIIEINNLIDIIALIDDSEKKYIEKTNESIIEEMSKAVDIIKYNVVKESMGWGANKSIFKIKVKNIGNKNISYLKGFIHIADKNGNLRKYGDFSIYPILSKGKSKMINYDRILYKGSDVSKIIGTKNYDITVEYIQFEDEKELKKMEAELLINLWGS